MTFLLLRIMISSIIGKETFEFSQDDNIERKRHEHRKITQIASKGHRRQ